MKVQKRLAAQILKCGRNAVRFDPYRLTEIKEAITKKDIKALIGEGAISKGIPASASRFWARNRKRQKVLGRQKGFGSRKGKKTARTPQKRKWINKIRLQRSYLKMLRDKKSIPASSYHELYMKSKGGFFRSLRHLKLYTRERAMTNAEK
ncbi:50S ribosomal protein L19e [Candidatus Woesearchaeota archaeon]|nr:50S ribosomal protein L19e [Candidatus Woesearchaeota archaeon]